MAESELTELLEGLHRARAQMRRLGIRPGVNNALMVERALDRGVDVTGGPGGWVQMSFRRKSGRFNAGTTNLNSQLARRLVLSKEVTSRLLRSRGFNAPENAVFRPDELHRAWTWAKDLAPVVVKPAQGRQGRLVHVGIQNLVAFERAFTAVGSSGSPVLVEKAASGTDHRLTVIKGAVVAATRRTPANVVGDGTRDIAELIESKNWERHRRANPVHKRLKLAGVETDHLRQQGLAPTSVPGPGQVVWLRGAANISSGGDALDVTDELAPAAVQHVERVASAIPGLAFCGFDLLIDEDPGVEPSIIEINGSPSVSPHHFPWEGQPRDVMTAVLESMFPALLADLGAGEEGKSDHQQ